MQQLMETGEPMLVAGPRHARPVTTWGRIKWALMKGPTNWTWKTNLVAMLMVIGVLVGVGLALGVAMMIQLFLMKSH